MAGLVRVKYGVSKDNVIRLLGRPDKILPARDDYMNRPKPGCVEPYVYIAFWFWRLDEARTASLGSNARTRHGVFPFAIGLPDCGPASQRDALGSRHGASKPRVAAFTGQRVQGAGRKNWPVRYQWLILPGPRHLWVCGSRIEPDLQPPKRCLGECIDTFGSL